MKIQPKKENENVGFHYTVTDEQMEAYSKLSIEQKLQWLASTAKFIYDIQTPEERERCKRAKNFKW
ncbi:MAG: hypothetical protein IPM51_17250 [Sphingobacteriaceae bacterium]|nr:hypothetical protein [Sphingobacteriaceae bacterium]